MDQNHTNTLSSNLARVSAELSQAGERTKIVALSTTSNTTNPDIYYSSIKYDDQVAFINFVFMSGKTLPEVIKTFDGKVDFFAIDCEVKNAYKTLKREAIALIKKSNLHIYQPNEITCSGLEIFIKSLATDPPEKHIAIFGLGQIGRNIAHKLANYGTNLYLVSRDKEKANTLAQKLKNAAGHDYTSVLACQNKVDIIIACTPGIAVVHGNLLNMLKTAGAVVDVGNGCVPVESIELLQQKDIPVYSFSAAPALFGYFRSLRNYSSLSTKQAYARSETGHALVTFGYLGKNGDIVVDNAANPEKIYGKSDGLGSILPTTVKLADL